MKHYVLATQRPWGVKVFEELKSPSFHLIAAAIVGRQTDHDLRQVIAQHIPRYVFFVNWSSIVPSDILTLSECVNFHCTALPFGAGGHPIENLLLRGFTETIITAHRMTDVIDGGPIYKTSEPISLAGTKAQILDRFVPVVVDLIRYIVDTEPEPYHQVGEIVNFKRLDKAAYEAFWKARA